MSSFGPWVRRAESNWGTCRRKLRMGVRVKPRRPLSLALICVMFPDYSSFSVFRETLVAFPCKYFKKLNGYYNGKTQRGEG